MHPARHWPYIRLVVGSLAQLEGAADQLLPGFSFVRRLLEQQGRADALLPSAGDEGEEVLDRLANRYSLDEVCITWPQSLLVPIPVGGGLSRMCTIRNALRGFS